MKTRDHLVIIVFLFVALTSCTSVLKPTESTKPTGTIVSLQTIQPTQAVIPAELAFSTSLVQLLSQFGLSILSVQSSTYMAMFQSTNKAVWIQTDEGITEAIFFADAAEAEQIHIIERSNPIAGRYLYTIQAPPPTLLHDQTIDAAFPLYFIVHQEMLMVTSSEELDKTLKHIFSGQ